MKTLFTSVLLLTYINIFVHSDQPDYLILNDNQICTIENNYDECSQKTVNQGLFVDYVVNTPPLSTIEKALITPPLEWGKEASPNADGKLIHTESYKMGWVSLIKLNNLAPNQKYMLTLNGNPELDGNELLPEPVPGLEEERYWDILEIKTDASGNFEKKIAVQLTPGDYHIRFYVKDQRDYKIVLYHDYFRFSVKK